MIDLAIVIINYKTPELTLDCLESLFPNIDDLDAQIWVVDNASNDGSCELIQNWLDQQSEADSGKVTLIQSKQNTGFSGGNNYGVSQVEARYYLLLNSDTVVREGAINTLFETAKKEVTAGLISPRLEWPDGEPQESCFRFHSPLSELISSAKTGLVTWLLDTFNVPFSISETAGFYDWTSFACVLIRAEVFQQVGLMDEGYFMYYEDVAFAFHAQQAGWKVFHTPDAHIVHLRGGSSPVKSQAKQRKRLPHYYYESRTRYFYQIYGQLGLLMANICWTLGFGISSLRSLLSASFQPNTSADQWRDIWTNFFTPLKSYQHPDNYDQT